MELKVTSEEKDGLNYQPDGWAKLIPVYINPNKKELHNLGIDVEEEPKYIEDVKYTINDDKVDIKRFKINFWFEIENLPKLCPTSKYICLSYFIYNAYESDKEKNFVYVDKSGNKSTQENSLYRTFIGERELISILKAMLNIKKDENAGVVLFNLRENDPGFKLLWEKEKDKFLKDVLQKYSNSIGKIWVRFMPKKKYFEWAKWNIQRGFVKDLAKVENESIHSEYNKSRAASGDILLNKHISPVTFRFIDGFVLADIFDNKSNKEEVKKEQKDTNGDDYMPF